MQNMIALKCKGCSVRLCPLQAHTGSCACAVLLTEKISSSQEQRRCPPLTACPEHSHQKHSVDNRYCFPSVLPHIQAPSSAKHSHIKSSHWGRRERMCDYTEDYTENKLQVCNPVFILVFCALLHWGDQQTTHLAMGVDLQSNRECRTTLSLPYISECQCLWCRMKESSDDQPCQLHAFVEGYSLHLYGVSSDGQKASNSSMLTAQPNSEEETHPIWGPKNSQIKNHTSKLAVTNSTVAPPPPP